VHSHTLPLISPFDPIPDVVNGCTACTGSTGQFPGCYNCGSSLLNVRDEIFRDPFGRQGIQSGFSVYFAVVEIGEHGGTVVTPDAEIGDVIDMGVEFVGQLVERTVVV